MWILYFFFGTRRSKVQILSPRPFSPLISSVTLKGKTGNVPSSPARAQNIKHIKDCSVREQLTLENFIQKVDEGAEESIDDHKARGQLDPLMELEGYIVTPWRS